MNKTKWFLLLLCGLLLMFAGLACEVTTGTDNTDKNNDKDDTDTNSDENGTDTIDDTSEDTFKERVIERTHCDVDEQSYHACYKICYGCAMNDFCSEEYQTCRDHEACAAYDDCRAINCIDEDGEFLQGSPFTECDNQCKRAEGVTREGIDIYDVYDRCIVCKGCAWTCAKDDGALKCYDCDVETKQCYEDEGCWGCAMQNACVDQVYACSMDDECSALDTCLNSECIEDKDLSGDEWTACESSCISRFQEGVELLYAYHDCIYCHGCVNTCKAESTENDTNRCLGYSAP